MSTGSKRLLAWGWLVAAGLMGVYILNDQWPARVDQVIITVSDRVMGWKP